MSELIEEIGSIHGDIKKFRKALVGASHALIAIEGKMHRALSSSGTGRPIRDKKAKANLKGDYDFVKELESSLDDLQKKGRFIEKRVDVADARIALASGGK